MSIGYTSPSETVSLLSESQHEEEVIDAGEWNPEHFLLAIHSRIVTILKELDNQEHVVITEDSKVFILRFGRKIEAKLEETKQIAPGFEILSIKQIGKVKD